MNIFIVCVAYGDISIHSATIETSKSILSTVVEYIDDEQIDLYKSVVERKWEENCSDIHKIHKILAFVNEFSKRDIKYSLVEVSEFK